MRFSHVNGLQYFVVAFILEPVVMYGKTEYVTMVYCKDKAGKPEKFEYNQILKYE